MLYNYCFRFNFYCKTRSVTGEWAFFFKVYQIKHRPPIFFQPDIPHTSKISISSATLYKTSPFPSVYSTLSPRDAILYPLGGPFSPKRPSVAISKAHTERRRNCNGLCHAIRQLRSKIPIIVLLVIVNGFYKIVHF